MTLTKETTIDPKQPEPARRTFIVWYLGGLLGAMTLAILAPILVYIFPPPAPGLKKGRLTVKLNKKLTELQEGQGVLFDAPKDSAFIMKTGGGANTVGDRAYSGYVIKNAGKLDAFAVNCSHLGCSITLKDGNDARFECPCHGSMFKTNGSVLRGPATDPLARLDLQLLADDQVSVDGISQGPAT